MSELFIGQAGWSPDYKSPEDFRPVAANLRIEGHHSRADAVDWLIDRLKDAYDPDPWPLVRELRDIASKMMRYTYPTEKMRGELADILARATAALEHWEKKG
jgi:hypothetical protein